MWCPAHGQKGDARVWDLRPRILTQGAHFSVAASASGGPVSAWARLARPFTHAAPRSPSNNRNNRKVKVDCRAPSALAQAHPLNGQTHATTSECARPPRALSLADRSASALTRPLPLGCPLPLARAPLPTSPADEMNGGIMVMSPSKAGHAAIRRATLAGSLSFVDYGTGALDQSVINRVNMLAEGGHDGAVGGVMMLSPFYNVACRLGPNSEPIPWNTWEAKYALASPWPPPGLSVASPWPLPWPL